jgi:outer membrane protein assembly factor BamB
LLGGGAADWTGEVIGPPWLFSLKTVDVLTAGKAIYVFDKSNRKLWESKLAYPVDPGLLRDTSWMEDYDGALSPCVEREQTLYFFDQGVLTAFELASGNPRWRLTTVGISAIHFDDQGNMFVSTSSAGAESLKYSQQIDLSKRTEAVIMKVDSKSGKILWKVQRTGSDIYLSGKYLYTVESVPAGGMRIYRLDPRNGLPAWDHYEKRYTDNREFRQNTIQLLYDDELQVLQFMSL